MIDEYLGNFGAYAADIAPVGNENGMAGAVKGLYVDQGLLRFRGHRHSMCPMKYAPAIAPTIAPVKAIAINPTMLRGGQP